MKRYAKQGLALCAMLASGSVLASTTWVQWGGDRAWSNANNWNAGLPTNQEAVIKGDVAPSAQPIVSASDATTTKVSMYNGASLQIAAGGALHNTGVHNAGNSSSTEYSTLTVAGTYTVDAEFALGGWGSGSKGRLVVESSGTVNANGPWLIAGHEAGTEGEIVVNGGILHGGSVVDIGNSGSGTLTLNGGFMDATWELRLAYGGTSSSGQATINDGLLSVKGLNVGRYGPATIDFNGGQVVVGGNGLTQTANATFNFAANGGELILNGKSVAEVNDMIDNGAGTWNFSGPRSVTDDGNGNTVVAAIPEPATLGLMALFGGAVFVFRKRFP